MGADVTCEGMAELLQKLSDFPDKLTNNVVRGAIGAASKVVADEAKRLCPVGPPSGEGFKIYGGRPGLLRDSIKKRSSKVKGTMVTGGVTAGTKVAGTKKMAAGDAFYALWVEYGTAAHVITAKPGHSLSIGGRQVKSVKHPGARKQPFLRPAGDHTGTTTAFFAFRDYVAARIDKERINEAAPADA